jgi:hypothetical protein
MLGFLYNSHTVGLLINQDEKLNPIQSEIALHFLAQFSWLSVDVEIIISAITLPYKRL